MNDGLTPHRGNKTLPDDVPHDFLREFYRGDCLPTPNNVAFAEVHQMVKNKLRVPQLEKVGKVLDPEANVSAQRPWNRHSGHDFAE